MRWSCVVVAVAVLSLGAPSFSSAQDRAEEPAGYLKLIEAGLNEYYAHHFVEARALFAQAHALNPNARTLRVLGMAEFEMRRYPQSLEYLRAALASQVHPLDDELRARTQELEQRALTFVGQAHVDLQPAAASIAIDDVSTALPASGVLLLQAGEHTLEARAENYRTQRRKLDIKGGEELSLRISLERDLFEPVAAAQTPADSTPLYASPWLWTGVGVVLAGAATALIFALKPAAKVDFAAPRDTGQTPVGGRVSALQGSLP
jgi:tetratricopeptide (TPR) repeat protein